MIKPEIVHAASYCSTYIAVATDSGISVINQTDQVVWDYSDVTNDDYNAVWLSKEGHLYAVNETTAALEKWHLVANDGADEANGAPDTTWDESSTPALATTTPSILVSSSQLFVTENTSFVSPNAGNTIYLGHATGTTAIYEKAGAQTNVAVQA